MNLDTLVPEPAVGRHSAYGGYCGPAVKPIALNMVQNCAADPAVQLPISGIGGIANWRDAAEFIALGSTSVQVCTAIMHHGFRIVEDMIDGLSDYLDSKGLANVNALVGIKPTLGLVSRSGIVPIAHSQDTAGPMARTVADAALLLSAMSGSDPTDAATRLADRRRTQDYATSLTRDGLKGARIGVVRNRLFGYSPGADELAEAAIADLEREGAVIVDPAPIPTLGKFDDGEQDVLFYEFKADLNRYLKSLGDSASVHTLQDVIAFNDAHRNEELRYFGQEIMLTAQTKGPLTDPKYRAELARNHLLSRAQGIDATMTKYRLDALIAPTGGPAWLTDLVNGDGGTASAPGPSTVTSVAGYPHITVPMGFVRGLPVGLSFFGRAWSEPTLIKLAYAYEQATKHRRPPEFREHAETSR